MKIDTVFCGMMGENAYVVADEATKKAFIVDPGAVEREINTIIDENGYDVEYIILTHGHGDHIGGVSYYRAKYENAKVVACSAEKELLATPAMNLSMQCTGKDIALEADIWVNDGDTLEVGNMKLRFIHTPGHTEGGMCILADDTLFSGDTLFCQSIGRTDFPGGCFTEIVESIRKKLLVLPESTVVYPGHMGPTTIGIEKRSNPFV